MKKTENRDISLTEEKTEIHNIFSRCNTHDIMKHTLIFLALLSQVFLLKGQSTVSDVFNSQEIVWFGLDFSQARFIGQFDQAVGAGVATSSDLKHKLIPSLNELIRNEPTKYDIAKFLKKKDVYFDMQVMRAVNEQIDESNLISDNDFLFEDPQAIVRQSVKNYPMGDKTSGVGVVFIVEYFSKPSLLASVYVTYFDIQSREVLFSEKLIGKPRGITLRNFWAGAIFNIMTDIEKKEFNAWKKKYSK